MSIPLAMKGCAVFLNLSLDLLSPVLRLIGGAAGMPKVFLVRAAAVLLYAALMS